MMGNLPKLYNFSNCGVFFVTSNGNLNDQIKPTKLCTDTCQDPGCRKNYISILEHDFDDYVNL